MGVEKERKRNILVFLALSLWEGFSRQARWREKPQSEKMEKSERVAMVFDRSVINKKLETHSNPVIDLTARVNINTRTHLNKLTMKWTKMANVCELYMTPEAALKSWQTSNTQNSLSRIHAHPEQTLLPPCLSLKSKIKRKQFEP